MPMLNNPGASGGRNNYKRWSETKQKNDNGVQITYLYLYEQLPLIWCSPRDNGGSIVVGGEGRTFYPITQDESQIKEVHGTKDKGCEFNYLLETSNINWMSWIDLYAWYCWRAETNQ